MNIQVRKLAACNASREALQARQKGELGALRAKLLPINAERENLVAALSRCNAQATAVNNALRDMKVRHRAEMTSHDAFFDEDFSS